MGLTPWRMGLGPTRSVGYIWRSVIRDLRGKEGAEGAEGRAADRWQTDDHCHQRLKRVSWVGLGNL